jgi:predicted nucleotidyltransferase
VHERLFTIDGDKRGALIDALADALAHEADVVFAYLHGSFVRGDPFHDIDVGVYLAGSPSDQTRRSVDLAVLLSRRVNYPVDVRALNAAPLAFAFHALQGELLISRDDRCLFDTIESVGRRYLDIAPILRRATRDAFTS